MSKSAVSSKRMKMNEQAEGIGSEGDEGPVFDSETLKVLEELDASNKNIEELEAKSSDEILKVGQTYSQRLKPHYKKRSELIKNIPYFWATVFVNHPQISKILDEEEEKCLHFLIKCKVKKNLSEDNKYGYSIKFYFKENPYFTNSLLVKEFYVDSSDFLVSKSTEIAWKKGNNLIQRHDEGPAQVRGEKKQSRTFFKWFMDNHDALFDDIAKVIVEDLWYSPLQYFLYPDVEDEKSLEGEYESGTEASDEEED